MDNCLYKLSVNALNDELSIIGRILYKVKNQLRHQKAFQHLQGVRRHGKAIMTYTTKAISKDGSASMKAEHKK